MAITQEQFDKIVSKLEGFSQNYPRLYRLRVALFAALGYGYIFLILISIIGLIWLTIFYITHSPRVHTYFAYFVGLLFGIAAIIVRSLWVTLPPPKGIKLSRRQVPHLFSLVDDLTIQLQTPKFRHILLSQEFNAAVYQIPRLGIFGWPKNYLVLGLPLMQSLSLEQFKAVIAHELGHLSGNHAHFGAWIYRIRKTWMQIYEQLHQESQAEQSIWLTILAIWSSMLFNSFLDWYWPAFNAYSFVLARMNEYEADRCSVQLAGAKNMAEALIIVEVKALFLTNSFWPDIHKQAERQVTPPHAYSWMLLALQQPIATEQSNQWLEQALAQKTNNVDTHPCLSDRLQPLGYLTSAQKSPEIVTIKTSAAESLLGDELQQFTQQFDQNWQEAVSTSWRQRYAYLKDVRSKLEVLEINAKIQALNAQELWEQAYYTRELHGNEAVLPLLRNLLNVSPDHADANYALGQALLSKVDPEGVVYIEKAITQRPDWALEGYNLIYDFFWKQGQTEAAETYRQRAEEQYQTILAAQYERANIFDRDKFKPHTLKAEEVSALKEQLATFPEVKEAYLVEKVVRHFPENRFFVLGVVRNQGLIESETAPHRLVESLAKNIRFPYQSYIIVLNHGSSRGVRDNIRQVERSLILRKLL